MSTDLRPAIVLHPDARFVLVKGYYDDSGTVEGVYGPYTEQHADWMLRELLASSTFQWTKVKLASGPEES